MLRSIIQNDSERFAHNLAERGYTPIYREHAVNHCPGCGRTHWYVGRTSAECAFCATALPLQEGSARAASAIHTHNNRPVFFQHNH